MCLQQRVKSELEKFKTNELIVARTLYVDSFMFMPEMTFFKVLERLVSQGELVRIAKGVYCKPKNTRFGVVASNEEDIVKHYAESGRSGMVVGYRLYNREGLTTQISKTIKVYSNRLQERNKSIRNVSIHRVNVEFEPGLVKHIEAFEILENYRTIEDLDAKRFAEYVKSVAGFYDDTQAVKAIETGRYKKRTIAFMQAILIHYNVPNTLARYISATSVFNIPKMEELYATAS